MNANTRRRVPVVTIVLFVVAIALLLFSTIGATRAVLIRSDEYNAQLSMQQIGVTLNETSDAGTQAVSNMDYTGDGTWDKTDTALLSNLLADGENFQPGKTYTEELSLTNSGDIVTYVRITIYRFWCDEDGNKVQELDPSLIELNLTNNGWVVDESATTPERIVAYYTTPLEPGETTTALCDTLRISSDVTAKGTATSVQNGKYTTITVTYDYDGMDFVLQAEGDAVQALVGDTYGSAAILSAWGLSSASVSGDGTLSLG